MSASPGDHQQAVVPSASDPAIASLSALSIRPSADFALHLTYARDIPNPTERYVRYEAIARMAESAGQMTDAICEQT
jgi:hypothetical protein